MTLEESLTALGYGASPVFPHVACLEPRPCCSWVLASSIGALMFAVPKPPREGSMVDTSL